MLHLRSFVYQRLYAAAEEIFVEVEKTISLALHEARTQRPKENHHSGHPEPDRPQHTSETQLTSNELKETLSHPSTQEESNLRRTEAQDRSETSGGRGFFQIDVGLKVEQEELGEHSEIQVVVFPSDEVVKREQDYPEVEISDAMQLASSECSEAEIDSNGSDEEWARNTGAKTKRQKPGGHSSVRRVNGLLVCPTCGKGFQYIRPLMKHITTHKKTNESMNEFLHNLQSAYKKTFVCDFCGKKFASAGCLKTHSKIHTGVRDFRCLDCGKTFIQKAHLTVHKRTHSGERPYYCEFCGRAFSQKQNLLAHKRRIHLGNKMNNFGSEMIQVHSSGS